jgi:hypothetical protein
MKITFPIAVCLIGAAADFVLWAKLRHFRVAEKPPASRAGLSIEERQRKITIGRRILFASGCLMLAGAVFLAWLANSR